MMKKKRMRAIVILSTVLVVLLIVLILLVVNVQDRKYVIPEEEPLDEINIEDIVVADYYDKLMYIYLSNIENEHSLVLIPSDFKQTELEFCNNSEEDRIHWNIQLSKDDIDSYFDALEYFISNFDTVDASEIVNNGNVRYQILKYDDNEIECHYFLVMSNDISMRMILSFKNEPMSEADVDTLAQLKEVYEIDELEIPEENLPGEDIPSLEELDEQYGE